MLFNFTLIFGVILLIFGIRQRKIEKISQKFLYLPKKTDSNLMIFVRDFFSNIFTREEGINRKNALILGGVVLCAFVLNSLFLRLNFLLVLFLAIIFGTYFVNLLRKKMITDDFEKNFPEVLVIIHGAISAGSNVEQALNDCVNFVSGILKIELKKITKAMEIGDDLQKVFDASYRRLPFKNYYFFLTALAVSINSGARLKEILSRLSQITTRAKAIEKKKNAMTSEVRMSSKITAAIPFVFLILMKFIAPENFDFILYDEKGRYILYYFLASEAVGIAITLFLMRKI